jgi:hypothetical protein
MSPEAKTLLLESAECPEIRRAFYCATDGLIPLAELLEKAGLIDQHLAVLEALRALDTTEIGKVL